MNPAALRNGLVLSLPFWGAIGLLLIVVFG